MICRHIPFLSSRLRHSLSAITLIGLICATPSAAKNPEQLSALWPLLLGKGDISVTIDVDRGGRLISPLTFGNNIKNNDVLGLLDSFSYSFDTGKADTYLSPMKATTFRFPGGTLANSYLWKEAIGPLSERGGTGSRYYFGTAEFIALCRQMGAEPVITINCTSAEATAQYAADWVEYCNGSTSTTMGALRVAHGYPEPFNVHYWEIGNENYSLTTVADYADTFEEYYQAMKTVDSSIEIGAVAAQLASTTGTGENIFWNENLFSLLSNKVDFYVQHYYAWLNTGTLIEDEDRNEAFVAGMTSFATGRLNDDLITAQNTFSTSDYDIPIYVTEYNAHYGEGGMGKDQASTMNGVVAAGMLTTFLRLGIPLTHHWEAFSDGWDRFSSISLNSGYSIRKGGSYYILPMYEENASGRIAEVDAESPLQTYKNHKIFTSGIIKPVVNAPVCDAFATVDDDQLSLFLINRSLHELTDINIEIRGAQVSGSPQIQVFCSDDVFDSSHEVTAISSEDFSSVEPCSVTLITWPIATVDATSSSATLFMKEWNFSDMAGWSFSSYGASDDVMVYSTNGATVSGETLPTLDTPTGTGALQLDISPGAGNIAENDISVSFMSTEELIPGSWYKAEFSVKTSQDSSFSAKLIRAASPWTLIADSASASLDISTTAATWKTVQFLFTPTETISSARLPVLYLGALAGQSFTLSNVKLSEIIGDANLLFNDQFVNDDILTNWQNETTNGATVESDIAPDILYPGGKGAYQFKITQNTDTSSRNTISFSRIYDGEIKNGELYMASFWLKVKGTAVTDGEEIRVALKATSVTEGLLGQNSESVLDSPSNGTWQRINIPVRASGSFSSIYAPVIYLGNLAAGTTVLLADVRLSHIPQDEISRYHW